MNGAGDEWSVAAAHAARLLPGVFPPDDPVEALVARAGARARRCATICAAWMPTMFAADDSLGWTYQFWRAAEKKAVNDSQVKIGAAELPAVTQLFTEPYMVRFLLHNTLGAWWAGKVLAAGPSLARDAADEATLARGLRAAGIRLGLPALCEGGRGLASSRGSFPGWPASRRRDHAARPVLRQRTFPDRGAGGARRAARQRGGIVSGRRRRRRAAR